MKSHTARKFAWTLMQNLFRSPLYREEKKFYD